MRNLSFVLILTTTALVSGRGGRRGMSGKGTECESNDEFRACRETCYTDRDCMDDSNLNCSNMCRKACKFLEDYNHCKRSMFTYILRTRGRISATSSEYTQREERPARRGRGRTDNRGSRRGRGGRDRGGGNFEDVDVSEKKDSTNDNSGPVSGKVTKVESGGPRQAPSNQDTVVNPFASALQFSQKIFGVQLG